MEVQYQRMYSIGQFLNERIGFEMEIPDDGDPVEEIKTLKKLCDKVHEAINPIPFEPNMEGMKTPDPINQRIASMIEDINQCTEIDSTSAWGAQIGLIAFKDAAEQNAEIKAAYDLKMQILSRK